MINVFAGLFLASFVIYVLAIIMANTNHKMERWVLWSVAGSVTMALICQLGITILQDSPSVLDLLAISLLSMSSATYTSQAFRQQIMLPSIYGRVLSVKDYRKQMDDALMLGWKAALGEPVEWKFTGDDEW